MGSPVTVALSSGNEGKLAELRALLSELPIELLTVRDILGAPLNVVEDAETLEGNAITKASAACRATGLICIADDSGLEVDALGGRPGVRSARFAHDRATDAENNAELLRALEDAEGDKRGARFRCVLALASPWAFDDVQIVEGRVEGTISRDPRGSGGFGYDPLFLVKDHDGRSMAELSESEKNAISHRAQAVRGIVPVLLRVIAAQYDEAERIAGGR